MTRRLTLELDEEVVERAAAYSRRTGKPVSRVVADLIEQLPQGGGGSEMTPKDGTKVNREPMESSEAPDSRPAHERLASPETARILASLPPRVRSLVGILEGTGADEEDYHRHLEEKYR